MKKFVVACLAMISMVWTHSALGSGPVLHDISALNQKLQKNNATWYANDNWLNHLSKSELKKMMGLKGTPPADVQFLAPAKLAAKALPSSLDWRQHLGKNWVSPILNQGNCGSCVAFAAIGVLETQMNIASAFPQLNMRMSPQNLFACGGGYCDYGWYPGAAAHRLMTDGVPDEACLPYTSGVTGEDVACESSCGDTVKRSRKIANYGSPTRSLTSVDEVKLALQHGPVMTTMTVYSDFMTYAGGVYKHTVGESLGGHAVSIVGYDDVTQSYIIRNSWSEEWGEKGFAHIAYSDTSGIGNSTWGFDIPSAQGAISVVAPRDYSFVSGEVPMEIQSTYTANSLLQMKVFAEGALPVWQENCVPQAQSCRALLNTASLKDGRYEFEAVAIGSKGEALGSSGRQFFYVVNQKPTLEVAFSGAPGTDLSKDLKGRVEFSVKTKTSSVPMSSLQIFIKASTGKTLVRTAELVLPSMVMGWRTNLVENGNYEIWFVGHLKTSNIDVSVESAHQTVRVSN